MKNISLKNGLNIVINQMPNTHSFTIGLYVRAGTRYESFEENGITHLLEHLHFRQLNNISQSELYYKMESVGSTLRASTYCDFLKFTMKACPKYLVNCIDIFKAILTTYNWSDKNFNQEKELVIKQIDESSCNISTQNIIRKNLLGDCNLTYDIMGNKETIKKLSISDVIAYKRKFFNRNNILICITGCICKEDMFLIEHEFETLQIDFGKKHIPTCPLPMLYHREPNIVLYNDDWDYMDVNITFDISYQVVSLYELKILNCILGEGIGSRLQMRIREKMQYTSDIFSQIEAYEDFAFLHIKYSIHKRQFIDCLLQIVSILEHLKSDICPEDLAVSIPFYFDNQAFLQDDTEQMNFEIAYNNFIMGQDIDKTIINNDVESIERLTTIARHVFVPKNMSVIAFGNYNDEIRTNIELVLQNLKEE